MVARRWVDHDAGLITTLGDATRGVLHQGFSTTPVSNVEMLPSRCSGAPWLGSEGESPRKSFQPLGNSGCGVRLGSSTREFGSGDGLDLFAQASW